MQVPIYQGQGVNTNVAYGSRSSGTVMEVANAAERLSARLSGAAGNVAKLYEDKITDETVQAALKDVQEGKIDSDRVAMVARNVYKNTANTALIADVEVSGTQLAKQIENQMTASGKYDVNSFAKSWNTYTKSTLNGIKDLAIKQNVATKLAHIGTQYSGAIGTLQAKQQREMQTENFKAKIAMDVESYNSAFGVNDQETIRLQNEISTTLQTMVDAGLIAPGTATMELKKINKGAYLSNLQRGLTTAINNGTAYKYYEQFKKMDHQGILDAKDMELFRNSIQSQIANDVGVYKQQLAAAETQFKIGELETIDTFNDELMSGTLTTAKVDQALATGKIDLATHETYTKKINQPKRLVDAPGKLLTFQTHVLDFTEDEIINSPHLTEKTKWDLVKQRRSELKDEGNWLSSQSGREARDRIKRTFNIIEGTLMAQMDFNNKNMQEYDTLYKEFYAEVEALPLDQRASKSISIADKLITNYKTKKEEKHQKKLEERKTKKEQEEKKSKETYGDTTGTFMNLLKDKWNSATHIWDEME